ncbi:MBL fold metallo-hydrolase [Pseudoxanthomonas sp. UTMC 1351]|uniref:MBL fold metallo-hydrolase n=1 Tax=Pseudoxanthomonas sp. UTMC 1351 TaxID=2695853 RepID=UPI0034CF0616
MILNKAFVLLAALAPVMLFSACSQEQPSQETETAPPAAPPTESAETSQSPDIFRFKIGALDAVALKDGDINAANDGKTFGVGRPTSDVAAVLAAAGQPTDVLHLSIQPLLVRSDSQVLLFDTGAADASFAKAGRLPASLLAAGVEPSQVTDIFISHRHQDHAGGLLLADGALAFPNATVHLSAPEWEALKADRDSSNLVSAITPKVATFEPGAAILPGLVTAVAVNGHTPGHSAYEITSGDQRLLYIGDSAHHYVISVQRPEWTIAYDENAPTAEASRRALLQRAADENLRIYSVHFPFPGLGHVRKEGESFVWAPEQ